MENIKDIKFEELEQRAEELMGLDLDISCKTGYCIYVPTNQLIDNVFIDYRLMYIIAYACGRSRMYKGDTNWYLSEYAIEEIVKPLYGEDEETFDNAFRTIFETGILKHMTDEDGVITDEYFYDTYTFWTSAVDVEVAYRIITHMHQDTIRVLTYMIMFASKKEVSPNMEYFCRGMGVKYTKKNKETIQAHLDYLESKRALDIRCEDSVYYRNKYTKKYYTVPYFIRKGLYHESNVGGQI